MRFRLPFIHDIKDENAREDFRVIQTFLADEGLLKGQFTFFEKTFTYQSYPQTVDVQHGLGFLPKDVIQTSIVGAGGLTWNYSDFTKETFNVTVTGEVTVRFFLGAYREN